MKDNVSTLKKREKFINEISNFLHSKFDLSDTQIFIFGSFLTDKFIHGESDINIGIYSEDSSKVLDIHYELEMLLYEKRIKHTLVDMELHELMTINIPIMLWSKTLTDYTPDKMINYLIDMIKKHGEEYGVSLKQESVHV